MISRRYFMDIVRQTKKQKGLVFQIVALIGKLYHLEKLLDDNLTKVSPQSLLGKAVHYMLTHWQALNYYLLDGRLEIDNNRSERSIKPFVIGRKNRLFDGNDKGARAGATLYSLTHLTHGLINRPYFLTPASLSDLPEQSIYI